MRQEIIKVRKECEQGIQKLNQLLFKKQKRFKAEELQTSNDSVRKLSENIRIIGELFEDQNKKIGRALRGKNQNEYAPAEDIEN